MKNTISSLSHRDKVTHQLKNYAKYIALALLMSCSQCKKDPDIEPDIDKQAPTILLKQTSMELVKGDQVVPNTLVISISDNTDPNPTITASLNGQNISYTTAYIFSNAGEYALQIKAIDKTGNTSSSEVKINVGSDVLTIPQMQIMPTDPAFDPNSSEWLGETVRNWTDYLKTLKVPEVRAMGESMVRSGTNDMSKEEYLSKFNKRQLSLNSARGITIGTDADGQYIVPNTVYQPDGHENSCCQILIGKKNNGIGATGLAGPLIQQGGVNKLIQLEDGVLDISNGYYSHKVLKDWLNNNPGKYLIISNSSGIGGNKEELAEVLKSGRIIRFQGGGNNTERNGSTLTISATQDSYTGDDTKEMLFGAGAYSYGSDVPIHVQRVGGCFMDFQITTGQPTKEVSTFLTGDKKDIRYAPTVHAYVDTDGGSKLVSSNIGWTSLATPTQTGLFYLLMACHPELTPVELLELARTTYAYPVKVDYAPNPSMGYTSKTIDIGKAYKDLNSKIPSTISLSSSSPIQIQKGRYKFNIIHGDGVTLLNGNKVTNTDVNDIAKRGQLSQENYVIDPATLKKMGKKAGDEITIHVSVCADAQEQYKQIRDIEYKVTLTN